MWYFHVVCRFAVAEVTDPPLATAHHSAPRTTDVEVHPSPSQRPLSRRLESPKRDEGPLHKLVTVVRRESSGSSGRGKQFKAHQIEDANFADVPSHDDEAPVTQDLKVSPMISKYVPRNLRESVSVNGFTEKGSKWVDMWCTLFTLFPSNPSLEGCLVKCESVLPSGK